MSLLLLDIIYFTNQIFYVDNEKIAVDNLLIINLQNTEQNIRHLFYALKSINLCTTRFN